jgi:hypothetical protein
MPFARTPSSRRLASLVLVSSLLTVACGDDGGTGSADGAGGGAATTSTSAAGGQGQGGDPASSTSATGSSASSTSATGSTGAGGAPEVPLDEFTARAAGAICGALFRCCDGAEQARYFAPHGAADSLAAYKSQIPPAKSFVDEAECKSTLGAMLAIEPFGDWVTQAQAGKVSYDAASAAACVSALEGAACGDDVTAALFDSTCLAFVAPSGGANQRSMFDRTAAPGTACSPIFDGTGARLFGTCDPTKAFCCYENPANPGKCAGAVDASGQKRSGTCKAASAAGQACYVKVAPLDFQICATGLSCGFDSGTCVADLDGPLAAGDACVDANEFNVLGNCQNSYCDVFDTLECQPLKTDGASCMGSEECASGGCNCATPGDFTCPASQRTCGVPVPYCAAP